MALPDQGFDYDNFKLFGLYKKHDIYHREIYEKFYDKFSIENVKSFVDLRAAACRFHREKIRTANTVFGKQSKENGAPIGTVFTARKGPENSVRQMSDKQTSVPRWKTPDNKYTYLDSPTSKKANALPR